MLSTSLAEARRVKRQQANRNPFTTYFPPSQKFGKKKLTKLSFADTRMTKTSPLCSPEPATTYQQHNPTGAEYLSNNRLFQRPAHDDPGDASTTGTQEAIQVTGVLYLHDQLPDAEPLQSGLRNGPHHLPQRVQAGMLEPVRCKTQ